MLHTCTLDTACTYQTELQAIAHSYDAVEAHCCVDTDSEMSLDEQYTSATVDIIQCKNILTRGSLSAAHYTSNCQRPLGQNVLPLNNINSCVLLVK